MNGTIVAIATYRGNVGWYEPVDTSENVEAGMADIRRRRHETGKCYALFTHNNPVAVFTSRPNLDLPLGRPPDASLDPKGTHA